MKIERFDFDTHGPVIGRWLRERGHSSDIGTRDLYPDFGVVVDDCVVGFLYRTDAPKVGYLDGVIADPGVTTVRRLRAIDALCAELVRHADAAGLKLLWAQSAHESLVEVCERNAFIKFGTRYTCLVRVRKD